MLKTVCIEMNYEVLNFRMEMLSDITCISMIMMLLYSVFELLFFSFGTNECVDGQFLRDVLRIWLASYSI